MENLNELETRIVESAKTLFVERGFEKTNMSDIATAVGINRSTLHYYFRTKDKMFQAVFGSLVSSFLPRIQDIFSEDIEFMDKIKKILDEYIDIFLANPSLPKFILGEIQRDVKHLLDVMQSLQFDYYLSSIEKIVLEEMEKGNLKKVPIPFVFLTFYSQMTFPFLSKNLIIGLFYDNEDGFDKFLEEWKANVMWQMRNLLME